ncbi:MAG: hypothetical protein PHQ20_04945, partial [Candidatus Moranbacteria bacterium]|nr:hypothetical protein [Candidatus Moranbacteria bacterium]
SYTGEGEFQQITLTIEDPLDLSDLETKGGYLQYEIYISDPDSIIDFNTELGNQMDTNELEWSKANHPYFIPGWNQVSLPIDEAISTGQVDWQAIAHFRTYFKFSQTNQIKIKNLSFKAYPKPTLSEEDYFAIDFDTYNLTDDQDQAKAVKIISAKADANQQAIEEWKDQYQQELLSLSQTVSNMNDFDTMILDLVNSHEERIAVLEGQVAVLIEGGSDGIMTGGSYFTLDENGDLVSDKAIQAPSIEADTVSAGEYKLKENEYQTTKNVGSVVIYAGQQEVFIANENVRYNSKIIVTPVGSNPVNWVVSDKIDNQGFKIRLSAPAEFDIAFDYWIISVEN